MYIVSLVKSYKKFNTLLIPLLNNNKTKLCSLMAIKKYKKKRKRIKIPKTKICPLGQNTQPEEVGRLAVLSAIKYHRDNKVENNEVSII